MPYKNVADKRASERRRYHLKKADGIAGALGRAAKTADDGRAMRKLADENAALKKALAAETKRADAAHDIREGVLRAVSTPLYELDLPHSRIGRKGSAHRPILFTSDFQYGEVVDLAEMDGMNEFNRYIFEQRYALMIDKTIRWCDAIADGWGAMFPKGIIYLRGGDAISGEIHEELRETNDLSAAPACRELVRIERAGIRRLREKFGHVHVISIPGNHGRSKVKPVHKGYTEHNWESVLSWWLADSLADDKGVTFEFPKSGFARFEAEGWRFLMLHGDRMGAGGGTGFIGAPAPITKGHLKQRVLAAELDDPVDFVLTGHLHTSMKLPRGFANGCMPGYNEFARNLGLQPDAAKQWLLLAHKERVYGIELELSPFPRRRAGGVQHTYAA